MEPRTSEPSAGDKKIKEELHIVTVFFYHNKNNAGSVLTLLDYCEYDNISYSHISYLIDIHNHQ